VQGRRVVAKKRCAGFRGEIGSEMGRGPGYVGRDDQSWGFPFSFLLSVLLLCGSEGGMGCLVWLFGMLFAANLLVYVM